MDLKYDKGINMIYVIVIYRYMEVDNEDCKIEMFLMMLESEYLFYELDELFFIRYVNL